jgi:hypothetical protein
MAFWSTTALTERYITGANYLESDTASLKMRMLKDLLEDEIEQFTSNETFVCAHGIIVLSSLHRD